MSTVVPTVSRRRVLAGAAGLVALGVAAPACSPPPAPPQLDHLRAQLAMAESDSELATAAAAAAPARMAPTLEQVAIERSAHARALADEITRTLGHTETTTPDATTTSTSATPAAAPNIGDVTKALRKSADSATELAAIEIGYRAGLLGSIAASCTAAAVVGLGMPEPTS